MAGAGADGRFGGIRERRFQNVAGTQQFACHRIYRWKPLSRGRKWPEPDSACAQADAGKGAGPNAWSSIARNRYSIGTCYLLSDGSDVNDIADNPQPRRLLLATDMTPRCDRPLERAKQLALEWRADLTVLVVQQGPSTPEEVSAWLDGGSTGHAFAPAARAELAEEFAGTGLAPSLQVLEGDVTDGILEAAATFTDALVVIGASTNAPMQKLILGSTAARLAQELAHPLLVVRQRTRGSYGRILVANDFSDASRRALETALRLFPGRPVTLLHVLEEGANGPAELSAEVAREAREKSERFLEGCPAAVAGRGRIRLATGRGLVTEAVTRHVVEEAVGLVVLGVHRQSAVARVFMGSTSEDLMQQLPCDTLLVRASDGGQDGDDG